MDMEEMINCNECSKCGQQFSGVRALITHEERWCAGSITRLNAPTVFNTNQMGFHVVRAYSTI